MSTHRSSGGRRDQEAKAPEHRPFTRLRDVGYSRARIPLPDAAPANLSLPDYTGLPTSSPGRWCRSSAVVKGKAASPPLAGYAVDLLGLTLLTREGRLALYVLRVLPPPDR